MRVCSCGKGAATGYQQFGLCSYHYRYLLWCRLQPHHATACCNTTIYYWYDYTYMRRHRSTSFYHLLGKLPRCLRHNYRYGTGPMRTIATGSPPVWLRSATTTMPTNQCWLQPAYKGCHYSLISILPAYTTRCKTQRVFFCPLHCGNRQGQSGNCRLL